MSKSSVLGLGLMFLLIVPIYRTSAQTEESKIIYLKNGTVVKGIIVEMIPDKAIKIRTADGGSTLYQFSEIEKIDKDTAIHGATQGKAVINMNKDSISSHPNESVVSQKNQESRIKGFVTHIMAYAAWAVPMGEFGSTESANAGFAKNGPAFGLDYTLDIIPRLAWTVSINTSVNYFDLSSFLNGPDISNLKSGSYVNVWFLTGGMLSGTVTPDIDLHILGEVGGLMGFIPEVEYFYNGSMRRYFSGTSMAFGFGCGFGATAHGFAFFIRYFSGEPQYNTQNAKPFYQPTSCVELCAGMAF